MELGIVLPEAIPDEMGRKKDYCCGHGKTVKADAFFRLTACAQPSCIGEPCNEFVTRLTGRACLPSTQLVDVFVLRSAFPFWKDETRSKAAPNLCKSCVDVAAAAADTAKAAAAAALLLLAGDLAAGGDRPIIPPAVNHQSSSPPAPLTMPPPAHGAGSNGGQLPPANIALPQAAAAASAGGQAQQRHEAVPAAAPGMQIEDVQLGRTAAQPKRHHASVQTSPWKQQEDEGRVLRRRTAPGAVAGAAGATARSRTRQGC
ncbi:hypothetical protein TSOC_006325 [Tetrabaena socialis]|uniref:Uncharacterized protein n=1 Tax=Tetrabaena socialis TaxID=47790 RepID=A0A2J8A3W4_9CHLO|nr:hypothetical protein TSOC_006325 [Tetrabaena socialis]|eukprot:PNH07222.1 hypothetical protein TSOC_006325 [Tetrabaena socialis]